MSQYSSSSASESQSDSELAQRVVGGDRAAFATIYTRYAPRIFGLVTRMLPTPDDREDVAQEIFLQVYRNLAHFGGRSSLYTWIYRIACNTCWQYRRRLRRLSHEVNLSSVPPGALVARTTSPDHEPEREAERYQLLTHVAAALRELPPRQRTVMVLGPIQSHSYGEMSRILGVTIDMIKGRLTRGRAAVRRAIERRLAPVCR